MNNPELELARRKLQEAEQDLEEAIENHESARVLNHCSKQVRIRRQRVSRLESGK